MREINSVFAGKDGGQWFVQFLSTSDGERRTSDDIVWEGWVMEDTDPVEAAIQAALECAKEDCNEQVSGDGLRAR